MKLLIQFFIALIPFVFSFSTSDPTLSIRFLYLSVFISCLVFLQLYRKKMFSIKLLKHRILIVLMLIFSSYLISALINGVNPESIYLLSKLFLIIVFVLAISTYLINNSLKDLFLPLILFSLFSSLIYFYQFFDQYDQIILIEDAWHRNKAFDNIAGSMGNKNLLASVHFLLLPILIYNLKNKNKFIKTLSVISLCFATVIFFQTQSRAVIGAIMISLFTFIFLDSISINRLRKFFAYFIFLIISGYIFLFSLNRLDVFNKEITKTVDFSSSQRFSLYYSSIDLISDNFIFGVGPGNWPIRIWEYALYNNTFGDSFAQRPHNDFLWFFAEGGFLAGISYILIFLILLKDSYWLIKNHKDSYLFKLLFSTILGYGFISFFDFPFERISHVIVFFLFTSIIIVSKLKFNDNKNYIISSKYIYLFSVISLFVIYVGFIRYDSAIHTNNAIQLKQKSKWNYVIKAIDRAYSEQFYNIDNTSTPLLWYRGVAYFRLKNYKLALKDFEKAHEVNPNNIHVLNNLGTSYQLLENSASAKLYYSKAINVNPSFKEARVNLSAILFNEKKYFEALSTILQSKVEVYWKRQRNNDTYDLYLKTIFNSYINDIQPQLNENEFLLLQDLLNYFNHQPAAAERKLRMVYNKSINLNLDFISTLKIISKN